MLQYVAVTLRLQELAEASERMGAGSVKRERLAVSRAVASAAARKDAGVLQGAALCCPVLQRVAVYCNVSECFVVCHARWRRLRRARMLVGCRVLHCATL